MAAIMINFRWVTLLFNKREKESQRLKKTAKVGFDLDLSVLQGLPQILPNCRENISQMRKITRSNVKNLRNICICKIIVIPSADRNQQLGAPSVSFVPDGRSNLSLNWRVCPGDAATGESLMPGADLGSLGKVFCFSARNGPSTVALSDLKTGS